MLNFIKILLVLGAILLAATALAVQPAGEVYQIRIEYVEKAIQGQIIDLSAYLDYATEGIGGYDLIIEYDKRVASFQMARIGQDFALEDGCGWEYFTYRLLPTTGDPNFVSFRFVGIAETNNGPYHPSCYLPRHFPSALFTMTFKVTNDRTYECAFGSIRFKWEDCNDNSLIDINGDLLFVGQSVYSPSDGDNSMLVDITDATTGYPTITGYQTNNCPVDPDIVPAVRFINGGIEIVCAEPIDATGDVNLNGIPYEIADLVLFGNYFPYGLGVFDIHPEAQPATTDVNRDKVNLSVADWQYMKQVIIGNALPGQYLDTLGARFYYVEKQELLVAHSDISYGAIFIVLSGNQSPTVYPDNMDYIIAYNQQADQTRVFIYSFEDNYFSRGEILGNVIGDVLSIETANYQGKIVNSALESASNVNENYDLIPENYYLAQNYPNPFNNATVIEFGLLKPGIVTFEVFNVLGKRVHHNKEFYNAGFHKLYWNGNYVASGIYYYRISTDDFVSSKKMILLK